MGTDILTFVHDFASQFDETSMESFAPETNFRELEEWSSMTALLIIAMLDEHYKVRLSGDEIRESNTIQDIYDKVIVKLNG